MTTATTVDATEEQARKALAAYARRHGLPDTTGASWMRHMGVLYLSVTPGDLLRWVAATKKHPKIRPVTDAADYLRGEYGVGPGFLAYIDLTIEGFTVSVLASWRTA